MEEEEEVPDAELVRPGREIPGMSGAWGTMCAVGAPSPAPEEIPYLGIAVTTGIAKNTSGTVWLSTCSNKRTSSGIEMAGEAVGLLSTEVSRVVSGLSLAFVELHTHSQWEYYGFQKDYSRRAIS